MAAQTRHDTTYLETIAKHRTLSSQLAHIAAERKGQARCLVMERYAARARLVAAIVQNQRMALPPRAA